MRRWILIILAVIIVLKAPVATADLIRTAVNSVVIFFGSLGLH